MISSSKNFLVISWGKLSYVKVSKLLTHKFYIIKIPRVKKEKVTQFLTRASPKKPLT